MRAKKCVNMTGVADHRVVHKGPKGPHLDHVAPMPSNSQHAAAFMHLHCNASAARQAEPSLSLLFPCLHNAYKWQKACIKLYKLGSHFNTCYLSTKAMDSLKTMSQKVFQKYHLVKPSAPVEPLACLC